MSVLKKSFLTLNGWITDPPCNVLIIVAQIRENGEQFVNRVVRYLQRKLPNIHGPGPLKEEHLNKVNFHPDSLAAILVSFFVHLCLSLSH